MRIVLIGSGNVATALGKKILKANHTIIQVYSRNGGHAELLAKELNTQPVSSLSVMDVSADLYIIAVADDALSKLDINLSHQLVVHTAGSISIDVLKRISSNYGVLYPLQSIRKETEATEIPFLIDANSEENILKLEKFALTISKNVQRANDEDRRKLHLAAVITNNFSNYLYTLAEKYCTRENVDFRMLLPLLNETVDRLKYESPSGFQTGPAIRHDSSTMEMHKKMLEQYPELGVFYEFFSEKIMKLK